MPASQPPAEPDEKLRPALTPPQFSLRLLLAFTTMTAVSLVLFQAISPMASAILIFFGFAVLAHVAGNAIGTRLTGARGPKTTGEVLRFRSAGQSHFAPTTRLSHRQRLGRLMRITTALGAIAGGLGGGGMLTILNWDHVTLASGALATVSCGVLGGFFGFWLSSFTQIFVQAWRQAHNNSDPNPTYRRRR